MHDSMMLYKDGPEWECECVCGNMYEGTRLGALSGWISHWHDVSDV